MSFGDGWQTFTRRAVATTRRGDALFYRGQAVGKRAVQGKESMVSSGEVLWPSKLPFREGK
jgi:hypothetical protein